MRLPPIPLTAAVRLETEAPGKARPLGADDGEDRARQERDRQPAHGESFYPALSDLKDVDRRPDTGRMKDPAFAIPYLVLWAAMMRALLVRAQILPATCNRCGRPYERRDLGETVCSCARG